MVLGILCVLLDTVISKWSRERWKWYKAETERKGKLQHSQKSHGTILVKGVGLKYWWRSSRGKKHLPLKTMGKITPWDFVFPDSRTAAAQFSVCREGTLAGVKHDRCVVTFPSGLSNKCSSEILPMQSRVRVWKGGRVAFPVFWKYVQQMSNRWNLQHQQPFQAGLLTLQACQVFETVGKALMMRFLVPTCSLSTTNNYPRTLSICSFMAFPNIAYIPHLITYKRVFSGKGGWNAWIHGDTCSALIFQLSTAPVCLMLTGICPLVTDGSCELIVLLMFNIQQLVSIILAAGASVMQQIVTRWEYGRWICPENPTTTQITDDRWKAETLRSSGLHGKVLLLHMIICPLH